MKVTYNDSIVISGEHVEAYTYFFKHSYPFLLIINDLGQIPFFPFCTLHNCYGLEPDIIRAQYGGNNNNDIINRGQAANERCGGHL